MTLIIAQAAAIVSYLPVGIIASKAGRKKTILAGVVMLTIAFGTASFLRAGSSPLLMNCMFALAGIAWAAAGMWASTRAFTTRPAWPRRPLRPI